MSKDHAKCNPYVINIQYSRTLINIFDSCYIYKFAASGSLTTLILFIFILIFQKIILFTIKIYLYVLYKHVLFVLIYKLYSVVPLRVRVIRSVKRNFYSRYFFCSRRDECERLIVRISARTYSNNKR